MKSFPFLLIALLFAVGGQSQISGVAKDAQGKPVKGATISLLATKDSAVVKLAVTKETGIFNFTDVKQGRYLVKANIVEYQPAFSAPFDYTTAAVNVPDFTLEKLSSQLKGVVVTAQKPMFKQHLRWAPFYLKISPDNKLHFVIHQK